MNNGNMPAMPCTGTMDTKMTKEEFDNETAGGRYLPIYGLTKREYFAARAMQGLLSSDEWRGYDDAAKDSVNLADALLKQLNKG